LMSDENGKWRLFPKKHGVFAWVWLIYLAFPLYNFLHMPFSQSWIGYLLIFIFVITYWRAYWNPERVKVYIAMIMLITLTLCMIYDPGYYLLMFFVTYLIGFVQERSMKWVHIFVAGMFLTFVVIAIVKWEIHEMDLVYSIIPPMIIMMVLPYGTVSVERARRLRIELNTANKEIERLIKNQERQRIARDLHDTLGHTLSLITLKSELAGKLFDKDAGRAKQELMEIQATSRSALRQMRELISDMHEVSLDSEIMSAEQLLKAADIGFSFQGDIEKLESVPLIRNMLALCLREAITNVVKHSRAHKCEVIVNEDDSSITLTVEDDGIGKAIDANSAAGGTGRGLLGIQERLGLVDGTLHLERKESGGTKIRMIVPRVLRVNV